MTAQLWARRPVVTPTGAGAGPLAGKAEVSWPSAGAAPRAASGKLASHF